MIQIISGIICLVIFLAFFIFYLKDGKDINKDGCTEAFTTVRLENMKQAIKVMIFALIGLIISAILY